MIHLITGSFIMEIAGYIGMTGISDTHLSILGIIIALIAGHLIDRKLNEKLD